MSENETTGPDETRRYRKRPVVVDAVQFDGTWASVNDWLTALGYDEEGDGTDGGPACHMDGDNLVVQTLEGDMTAGPGWWIIRGVAGEFYPCEPSIFAQTYEVATTATRHDLRRRVLDAIAPFVRADDRTEERDPALAARLARRESERAVDAILAALAAAAPEPTCACGRPVSDPVHDGDWAQVVADLREENARLRTALGARPAPVVSAQWGVECDDDGDVSEAEDRDDAERIKAHHDRNCSHGHAIVRRVVTDWTTVADEGRAGA
jgi:hypothetical protein